VHMNRKLMTMMVRGTCTWTESSCQWWWEVHATKQEAHDNDGERHVHLNRKLLPMMVRGACNWTGSSWQWWWEARTPEQGAKVEKIGTQACHH
jgi:hypothetical protein